MRTTCAIGALFATAAMAAPNFRLEALGNSNNNNVVAADKSAPASGFGVTGDETDNDVSLPWERSNERRDEALVAEFDAAEAEAALVAFEKGADSFVNLVQEQFAEYRKPNHEDAADTCYNSRFQIIDPTSERNCYHAGYTANAVCRRFRGMGRFAAELADLADRVTVTNVNAFNPQNTQGALYKVVSGMFLLSDLLAELRRGLRVTTANFNEAEERNMEGCWDQDYVRALIAFLRIIEDFDNRFRLTYSDTPPGTSLDGFGFNNLNTAKREIVARELFSQGPTAFSEIFWAAVDLCGEQEAMVGVFVSKIRRRYIQQAIINDQGPVSPDVAAQPGQVNYYCRGILEWSSRLAPMIQLPNPNFPQNGFGNSNNNGFFNDFINDPNNGFNNNGVNNNNNNNNNNGFNNNGFNNNNNGFNNNNNGFNNNNNGFNNANARGQSSDSSANI